MPTSGCPATGKPAQPDPGAGARALGGERCGVALRAGALATVSTRPRQLAVATLRAWIAPWPSSAAAIWPAPSSAGSSPAGFDRRRSSPSNPARPSATACAPSTASTPWLLPGQRWRPSAWSSGRSKPQAFKEAAAACRPHVAGALQLSLMAGIRSGSIAAAAGTERVVRAMPNTPALIGRASPACHRAARCQRRRPGLGRARARADRRTLWVAHEADLDAVTALSGSGPAYVFYFVEAMMEAAAGMGLTPSRANSLRWPRSPGRPSSPGAPAIRPTCCASASSRAARPSPGGCPSRGRRREARVRRRAAGGAAAGAGARRRIPALSLPGRPQDRVQRHAGEHRAPQPVVRAEGFEAVSRERSRIRQMPQRLRRGNRESGEVRATQPGCRPKASPAGDECSVERSHASHVPAPRVSAEASGCRCARRRRGRPSRTRCRRRAPRTRCQRAATTPARARHPAPPRRPSGCQKLNATPRMACGIEDEALVYG